MLLGKTGSRIMLALPVIPFGVSWRGKPEVFEKNKELRKERKLLCD